MNRPTSCKYLSLLWEADTVPYRRLSLKSVLFQLRISPSKRKTWPNWLAPFFVRSLRPDVWTKNWLENCSTSSEKTKTKAEPETTSNSFAKLPISQWIFLPCSNRPTRDIRLFNAQNRKVCPILIILIKHPAQRDHFSTQLKAKSG